MKALGQHMEEEAADKLIGRQGQGFLLTVIAVVLVAELDLAVFDGEQTIIGDGHAVGIAAHIVEYLLGSSKGLFGVYHPFAVAEGHQGAEKDLAILQLLEGGKELQLAIVKSLFQQRQKQAAEEAGEHAHGKEETAPTGNPARAVGRQSAPGHDTMQVGMKHEVLSPAMQDGEKADLGAEMFGIGRNDAQGF